jgi:GNAT superfamily N-acetyltransferase
MRSLDDVRSWLAMPLTGTVETAAAPFWRLLEGPGGFGEVKVAVVHRPPSEVVASFLTAAPGMFDADRLETLISRLDGKLRQIERRLPGVLSLTFDDLATEAGCAAMFEHCLPYRHDRDWWERCASVNLQTDLPATLRYYNAHAPQLEKLAKTSKHRIVSMMAAKRQREPDDGVTFQTEPFRTFYRDARPLFAEHLVQTGQSPDDHARKNIPLLERLDDIGALQVLTGRINGRMFGYLMSVVAPSLDARDRTVAEHTIFFAAPGVRNLGMRLQRAAVEHLRARGVDEIILRAGHRGSGPRLGAFYRRLGAEPFGEMYRLQLGEV